jgi:TonB family protein
MSAARIRVVARFDAFASPLSRFMTVSLGLHVVIGIALVMAPSLRSRPTMTEPSLTAVLLPAPTRAAAAPPAETTPPAEPARQPPPPPREEVRAQPQEPPEAETEPEIPDTPPDEPDPAPPRSPDAPPAGVDTLAPDDDPAAGESAAATSGSLEGMGSEYAWYRDSVVRALYTAWRKPVVEGIRQPIEVAVTFQILRDGSVRGVQLAMPSGVPSLDRSALRAVSEASLPPLPRGFREPTQRARFVFRLFPQEG